MEENNNPIQDTPQQFSAPFIPPQNNQSSFAGNTPTSTPSSTIAQWPGAFGIYKTSKAAVKLNLATILIALFTPLILNIITTTLPKQYSTNLILNIIFELIGIFASSVLVYAAIEGLRDTKVDIRTALELISKKIIKIILTALLVGVISITSVILLVIPAFFIIPRTIFALYFVIDKDMGVIESIEASWNYTKGNVGKIYGIIGVGILIGLLVITIIGIPFAIYFGIMYSASAEALYIYATNDKTISV
jgi:uncharacterized membrane protein